MDLSQITVVVTAHDAGDALATALSGIRALGAFGRIHLVDSGSTDGSIEKVEERFPDLRVTRVPGNPGPCVSRNRGWREAETPFVLFVDDDMRLAEGCVEALLAEISTDPRIAMSGPRILFDDETDRVQYEGGFWHYAGLTHMRGQDGAELGEQPADVDVLTAGCVLVRREALERCGGFEESLFFLMEDVEMCLRLRYLGYRLVAVPAARAWNAGGSEGLSLRGESYPAERMRLHSRNRILVVLGLYDLRTVILLGPALALMDAAWFVFSFVVGVPGAFLRGKLELFREFMSVNKRRRDFLGKKVVEDSQLLGAPPLTLTPTAQASPRVRKLTRLLDKSLRLYWRAVRGLLPGARG